jgi:hypothetical protein
MFLLAFAWFSTFLSLVNGALYVSDYPSLHEFIVEINNVRLLLSQVNSPLPSTTCSAGKPCTVQWLDDGEQPLLTAMGACTVGLYYGEQVRSTTSSFLKKGCTDSLCFW